MIDLNSNRYLTRQEFVKKLRDKLSEVPEELVYARYLGPAFYIGSVILSPFRRDSKPSFGVFRKPEGHLVFNDFGDNTAGETFDFIFKYYSEVCGIRSYEGILDKFTSDFSNYSASYALDKEKTPTIPRYKKKEFKLEIRIRNINSSDIMYWDKFGISQNTLKLYNVFPISYFYINGKGYKADPLAYAYLEYKDDTIFIKIYQPYNKDFKWISNTNFSVHQGYRILPLTGDLLIITKSLKDVMSIRDVTELCAIGVQGEKARLKDTVLEEYRSRFKKIVAFFDNDNEGINLSKYFKRYYEIPYILIPNDPSNPKIKDFSSIVEHKNDQYANELLFNLLKDV